MTIPSLIQKQQDLQFKTAYKKAYSDLSQAVAEAIANDEFPYRVAWFHFSSTEAEWALLKSKFKVAKECSVDEIDNCWVAGDVVCDGACNAAGGKGAPAKSSGSKTFIDASGRAWATYSFNENLYLVDTNGNKGPNKFGKDRFLFSFADSAGNPIRSGVPVKVTPYINDDVVYKNEWCHYPPCYYHSWLFK